MSAIGRFVAFVSSVFQLDEGLLTAQKPPFPLLPDEGGNSTQSRHSFLITKESWI